MIQNILYIAKMEKATATQQERLQGFAAGKSA
jgi:hypothetical protein